MGYTHYWRTKNSTDTSWKKFTSTCRKLYKNLPATTETAGGFYKNDPIEIADGLGENKPIFNNVMVYFNGKGELGHETFMIKRIPNQNSDFCKTARKPYDLLVVACLIAAYQILDYRFCSDGFYNDNTCDDLQQGIDYYNTVIKPEIPVNQEILLKQRAEFK